MLCHLLCHQYTEQCKVAQPVPLAVPLCATRSNQGRFSRKLKLCHWHSRWHRKGGFSPSCAVLCHFLFIGVGTVAHPMPLTPVKTLKQWPLTPLTMHS